MPTSPSRFTLDEIKANLLRLLESEVGDFPKFERWLEALIAEIHGQLLCINLFIDLKNRCLEAAVVAQVIDEMAFDGRQPRRAFYEYSEGHQDTTLFQQLRGPLTLENDQYVRVLPLADMIEYYLRGPLMLNPLTYEAEREVLNRFFELPPDKQETLAVVANIWRGRILSVWVTSKNGLDATVAELKAAGLVGQAVAGSTRTIADVLSERLGLSDSNRGKLVGIVYPPNFDRAPVYVPTSLDANFAAIYYVSTDGADEWGKTFSMDVLHHGLRERIHRAFDGGLTDQYKMELFGELTGDATPNVDHLINEALTRAGGH